MKIVFIGDCNYNTGPSNVNKSFKKYLSRDIRFLKHTNKVLRVLEVVAVVIKTEIIVISGLSQINSIAHYIAKKLNKTIIYLMHGCYTYEVKENGYLINKRAMKQEANILSSAQKIITVSELFMKWAVEYFPEYREKFTYINNGIEWSDYEKVYSVDRDPYLILAMGGGRPQKKNIVICKAVQILNEQYKKPFKFVVLGRDYADTEKIKKSPYTMYLGQLSKDEAVEWFRKAFIYIQNSSFEPFGLAPIEALCSGCNLLISKNIGAISILNSVQEDDIIQDCCDPNEIAKKILKVHRNGNYKRLLEGIDREKTSCQFASLRLMEIIRNTAKENFKES